MQSRLYEIGIISRNYNLYFGISGIIARASGIMLDARLLGYEFYSSFDFFTFVAKNFFSASDC